MIKNFSLSRVRALALATLSVAMFTLTACGDGEPVTAAPTYNTTLNMRDFMNLVLDPTADVLWASAGWEDSVESGYEELYPTTDEEWENVRRHAAMIIEMGNSLALPGRALDGDVWMTYAKGLSNVGIQAMNAATEQNEEDFFQAGAQLYNVCTACHERYTAETPLASN